MPRSGKWGLGLWVGAQSLGWVGMQGRDVARGCPAGRGVAPGKESQRCVLVGDSREESGGTVPAALAARAPPLLPPRSLLSFMSCWELHNFHGPDPRHRGACQRVTVTHRWTPWSSGPSPQGPGVPCAPGGRRTLDTQPSSLQLGLGWGGCEWAILRPPRQPGWPRGLSLSSSSHLSSLPWGPAPTSCTSCHSSLKPRGVAMIFPCHQGVPGGSWKAGDLPKVIRKQ